MAAMLNDCSVLVELSYKETSHTLLLSLYMYELMKTQSLIQ